MPREPADRAPILADLAARCAALVDEGLFKAERVIGSPQSAHVTLDDGRTVLNLCANNYLGLAQHPEIRQAAHEGLDQWGYGLASVRFICGTQAPHKLLERRLSEFLGTDFCIMYVYGTVPRFLCISITHGRTDDKSF